MQSILIKKIDSLKLPSRQTKGAAGYDCYARERVLVPSGKTVTVPLGFAVMLPDNMEMQIRGRSGLSKRGLLCATGTIDSDYRGEVSCIITNTTPNPHVVEVGDRICQAVFAPVYTPVLERVDELPETDRGNQGFGSTGLR